MILRTTPVTLKRWPSALAALGVTALLLSGCTSTTPEQPPTADAVLDTVEEPAQPAQAEETGLTAESITAAAEAEGLACEEEDPRLKDREQLIVCKGSNYVIISATRLTSADLIPEQVARAKTAVCDSNINVDGTRFATSGAWVLSPGGGDDANVATFDAAMTTLGLDWSLDPC